MRMALHFWKKNVLGNTFSTLKCFLLTKAATIFFFCSLSKMALLVPDMKTIYRSNIPLAGKSCSSCPLHWENAIFSNAPNEQLWNAEGYICNDSKDYSAKKNCERFLDILCAQHWCLRFRRGMKVPGRHQMHGHLLTSIITRIILVCWPFPLLAHDIGKTKWSFLKERLFSWMIALLLRFGAFMSCPV